MAQITLTLMEQSALTGILIDHMRRPDSTLEWIDVLNEETITADGLLTKITRGGASITCPRCGLTSYNPGDILNRYCGNCHSFHADLLEEWIYGIIHGEPEPSGSFLLALAQAAARADPENRASLQPALIAIMARFPKYRCSCAY